MDVNAKIPYKTLTVNRVICEEYDPLRSQSSNAKLV